MALRAAKGDEDALARRSARAHACRVGTPADMFLGRVFNGAVACEFCGYLAHQEPAAVAQ
jgi:hypothetical protein